MATQQPKAESAANSEPDKEPKPLALERIEYENEQLRKQIEKATSELSLPVNVAVERRIANRDFRIHDLLKLAGTDSTIEGKEFENCTIRGPATITTASPPRPPEKGRGSIATAQVFHIPTLYVEGDPDSVLQEVPSGGATASGVIHLVGCSFKRVTFSGIAIAGNADELDWWRENATFSRGSTAPKPKPSSEELRAEVERLRGELDGQLKLRCQELSDELSAFLQRTRAIPPEETMRLYGVQLRDKVARLRSDLVRVGWWKPREDVREKLEYPETPDDLWSLYSYVTNKGVGAE